MTFSALAGDIHPAAALVLLSHGPFMLKVDVLDGAQAINTGTLGRSHSYCFYICAG